MFLVVCWGKKETEKQLGYVADFCPVCRRIASFAVNSVSIAGHVYFVAVEEGQFVGHTQRCLTCGTSFESHPGRFSRLLETFEPAVDRLASVTFPSVYEAFAERLALEKSIATDPHGLDPDVRKKVLMEPFHLASPHFENGSPEMGLKVLVASLRPLDPSEDEVRECLNHFRRGRARIGRMLSTASVLKKLHWKPSPDAYDY